MGRTVAGMGRVDEHSDDCGWPYGPPCRSFSTDGTLAGARIAHAMGTADEDEIIRMGFRELRSFESDVDAEQADW
jgi:hypothetical protein